MPSPSIRFPKLAETGKELKSTVRGEVRFDKGNRALYAVDGSNYARFRLVS